MCSPGMAAVQRGRCWRKASAAGSIITKTQPTEHQHGRPVCCLGQVTATNKCSDSSLSIKRFVNQINSYKLAMFNESANSDFQN